MSSVCLSLALAHLGHGVAAADVDVDLNRKVKVKVCTSDHGCGLLGTCSAGGHCVCYKGYTGDACASLDLVPAPLGSGLRQQGNRSNWCGTILQDEKDLEVWHMYVDPYRDPSPSHRTPSILTECMRPYG